MASVIDARSRVGGRVALTGTPGRAATVVGGGVTGCSRVGGSGTTAVTLAAAVASAAWKTHFVAVDRSFCCSSAVSERA